MFDDIKMAPSDPILGLNEAFKADKTQYKVNLGVGVYKNEAGDTPILDCVKRAENLLYINEKTKSYSPIEGTAEYRSIIKNLVFGENNPAIKENRIAVVQAPGGTGALRIGADFIKKFRPNSTVWLSNPSWENHKQLFDRAGIETKSYTYYKEETKWLDFAGMLKDVETIPKNDVVVFHACCHNPTGIDPTHEQWEQLADLAKKNQLIVFFDFAYQGFGKGIEEDAYAIRLFTEKVGTIFVGNSFSKNFGLYNERIGALSVVAKNKDEADRILSQLKICSRVNFSSPPSHGSAIISTIFANKELIDLWHIELDAMRKRIKEYRSKLVSALKASGVKENFEHILKQQGMFSYTGLTKVQVEELRVKHSIYMVSTGRISVPGLNAKNIEKVAKDICSVVN